MKKNNDKVDFDDFAESYSQTHQANIQITGENVEYFAQYKVLEIAKNIPYTNENFTLLDYGSGTGSTLKFFLESFTNANIFAADISEKSLNASKKKNGDCVHYMHLTSEKIPCDSNFFDCIFVSCVFHHIPSNEHISTLRELFRVLKPGGNIFIFEHNPYNPLTVHAVNTCPFDKDAVLITAKNLKKSFIQAGFINPSTRFTLFFPNILKKLRVIEKYLYKCPLGAQYYIMAQKL